MHPQARFYLEFEDFSFWRLEVCSLRDIGGFGRMSWVDAGDWSAAGVIAHMNADHADTAVPLR